jgi:hypothetical protein
MNGASDSAKQIAGAWYNDYITQLQQSIGDQIAQLEAQGKEVDPEYSIKLKELQAWADKEKASLNETMNSRGMLQSGVALGALSNLSNDKLNKMGDITQWAMRMKDDITNRINGLIQQRQKGMETAGEKRAAMETEYMQNAQEKATDWRQQYLNSLMDASTNISNLYNANNTPNIEGVAYPSSGGSSSKSSGSSSTSGAVNTPDSYLSPIASEFISGLQAGKYDADTVNQDIDMAVSSGALTSSQAGKVKSIIKYGWPDFSY